MRIPLATYRLQFTPSFGFKQANEIIEYLFELGISDIYACPIFKAKKGSLHGYDITDPNQLNPQLGSLPDFNNMIAAIKNNNMGLIADIVPNHMAFDMGSAMLFDCLENGRNSKFADFFDIRWDFAADQLQGKILVPVLGVPLEDALKQHQINIKYEKGQLYACYFEKKFPLNLKSYQQIFKVKIDNYVIVTKTMKKEFFNLYKQWPDIKKRTDENITSINNNFGALIEILAQQFYKLACWKEGDKLINYRRFFHLSDYIALKMENEKVFDHVHKFILELVKDKSFTGLRIDHVDGLYDPQQYLQRLRQKSGDIYIIVEKILAWDEKVRNDWPIQGTTGYDFLNYVNGIFCKTQSENQFSEFYQDIAGQSSSYDELLYKNKKLIIEESLAADLDYLLSLLKKIDTSGSVNLKNALAEILANFPVYRTYLTASVPDAAQIFYIEKAITQAEKTAPEYKPEYQIISKILLTPVKDNLTADFIALFQQISSVVMAKGFEDTFLYNYDRLISLNEVGGNPAILGPPLDQFHDFNKHRADHWPGSLNATSTHDTKRGQDVRARLNVLSEIPERWRLKVTNWMEFNQSYKTEINGQSAPDKNEEYFLYQTLIGSFPFEEQMPAFKERIKQYMVKALREAKLHSTWAKPENEYENACTNFIDRILDDKQFLNDFMPFQKEIAGYGIFNSLSQTLIKITSPGLPDFYQGSELWNLSLVDPDNRTAVDFDKPKQILNYIRQKSSSDLPGLIEQLLKTKEDGQIKLFLICKALAARKQYSDVFQKGSYLPLEVHGMCKDNVIAFARKFEDKYIVTIAPRFLTDLISSDQLPIGKDVWKDTLVQIDFEDEINFRNCFTEKTLSANNKIYLADATADFPVCLLATK